MKTANNITHIKRELEKELDRANTLLHAWKDVAFPVKKDGSPFAVLSKNIQGAKLCPWRCAIQPGENIIEVNAHSNLNGYINDTVYCYCMYKDIPETDPKKAKTKNLMPKIQYLNQVYSFDLDDIKTAIKSRIDYLSGRVADLEKQIAATENAYNAFYNAIETARAELENNAVFDNKDRTLFYAVLKDVQRNY